MTPVARSRGCPRTPRPSSAETRSWRRCALPSSCGAAPATRRRARCGVTARGAIPQRAHRGPLRAAPPAPRARSARHRDVARRVASHARMLWLRVRVLDLRPLDAHPQRCGHRRGSAARAAPSGPPATRRALTPVMHRSAHAHRLASEHAPPPRAAHAARASVGTADQARCAPGVRLAALAVPRRRRADALGARELEPVVAPALARLTRARTRPRCTRPARTVLEPAARLSDRRIAAAAVLVDDGSATAEREHQAGHLHVEVRDAVLDSHAVTPHR
jgi:hypothetical protein